MCLHDSCNITVGNVPVNDAYEGWHQTIGFPLFKSLGGENRN